MDENCANDSENTLVQFIIEVCHVLLQQYTNQCTSIRVVAVALGAAAAVFISSSNIMNISDIMQLCMKMFNYNSLIFNDDCNSVHTKNVEKKSLINFLYDRIMCSSVNMQCALISSFSTKPVKATLCTSVVPAHCSHF
jgi:hypothetical protein